MTTTEQEMAQQGPRGPVANDGKRLGIGLLVAGLLAGAVAGCATPPADPAARAEFEQLNDPIEPLNRYFFDVNHFLDIFFFKPWADTYRRVVPDFARDRVHSILDNMGDPLEVGNLILQGRFDDGVTITGRFLVNSLIGVGGSFDVANDMGLPAKNADFGQTLHVWGMGEGPYLVLPLFGPSSLRDALGKGVDTAADPVGWAFASNGFKLENYVQFGASALDQRSQYIEQLDALEKSSIDFYAQMRSMYRQHRAQELSGGGKVAGANAAYPNYDNEEPAGAKATAKPAAK